MTPIDLLGTDDAATLLALVLAVLGIAALADFTERRSDHD